MDAAVRRAREAGSVHGAFQLDRTILEPMRDVARNVGPTRTPNVIVAASESSDETVVVRRNLEPRVPRRYLTAALCLRVGDAEDEDRKAKF
jgi:hypothetical protein